ncbi:hypothetical protein EIP91_002848 [Steccherinum ochraceum]|uniref:Uncharacterized protein n=1 Tax=Steccherinum ochraceum TaxID=92696 RepID=A0A4R0RDW3_9APHY|nr:hypothetical protein EIP91_002848 [Steccherinum ochraceum]
MNGIQDALAPSLQDKLWKRFSTKTSYENAPNPGLDIQDVGIVGLPLGSRDADAIKGLVESRTRQTIKGEGGIGHRIWELDAEMVTFKNDKYQAFLDDAMKDACLALGVDMSKAAPQCKLSKMLLYGTGSHVTFSADAKNDSNVFATFLLVLPSSFTCGAAQSSYMGLTFEHGLISTPTSNLFKTSAMAWYTDVSLDFQPITSGCALALEYTLIHSQNCSRPVPYLNNTLLENFRKFFLSQMIEPNETKACGASPLPTKLLFLLRHDYSAEGGLCASRLKAVDAQKVAALDRIARESQHRVGLASLTCKLSGTTMEANPSSEKGTRSQQSRRPGASGRSHLAEIDSSDESDSDVSDGEVDWRDNPNVFCCTSKSESQMSVEDLVDLDGHLFAKEVELVDNDDVLIPGSMAAFRKILQKGTHVKQDFDPSTPRPYNGGRPLTRWYRRTVLLMWPRHNDFGVRYGLRPKAAYNTFRQAVTEGKTPSEEERGLAQFIISRRQTVKQAAFAAQTVCDAALRWNDPKLWSRAVEECSVRGKGLTIFKDDYAPIWNAVTQFGFHQVELGLNMVLRNDPQNTRRYAFLDDLESWLRSNEQCSDLSSIMSRIQDIRSDLASCLAVPSEEDCALLVHLASQSGNVKYIPEIILPQLKSDELEHTFFRQFAVEVLASEDPVLAAQTAQRTEVALSIIAIAIDRAPITRDEDYYREDGYDSYEECSDIAPDYLDVCLGVLDDAIPLLCKKITEDCMDCRWNHQWQKVALITDNLLPVLKAVAERKYTDPGLVISPELGTYVEWAAKLCVKRLHDLFSDDIKDFVTAMTLPKGADILYNELSRPKALEKVSNGKLLLFITELDRVSERMVLKPKSKSPSTAQTLSPLVTRYCAEADVQNMDSAALEGSVSLCFKWAPDAAALFLHRISHDRPLPNVVTSLATLHRLSQGLTSNTTRELTRTAFREITARWLSARTDLRDKPRKDLSQALLAILRCFCPAEKCRPCRLIRDVIEPKWETEIASELYLKESDETTVTHMHDVSTKVLEATRGDDVCAIRKWNDQDGADRFRLRITDEALTTIQWRTSLAMGRHILRDISGGDEQELQRVLGDRYESYVTQIRGEAPTVARVDGPPNAGPLGKRGEKSKLDMEKPPVKRRKLCED